MKKSFKDVIKTKLMTRVLCVVYCGSIFYSCHVQSLNKKNKKSYVSEEYLRQAEACMIITNQTPLSKKWYSATSTVCRHMSPVLF